MIKNQSMNYEIITVPSHRLRRKSEPVVSVDGDIKGLMKDMLKTMYKAKGCGLAAVQIGVFKRVIVFDISHKIKNFPIMRMANPKIIEYSDNKIVKEEGCLSVPKQFADIERHEYVIVEYLDENNELCRRSFEKHPAICVQHEIDHLDGKLFIDYLSKIQRDIFIKKVIRNQKYRNSNK